MKNIFIISGLFCCCLSVTAQFNVDSLKKIVYSSSSDSIIADACSKIAFTMSDDNPDTAIFYGFKGVAISDKLNNNYLKIITYSRLALAYDTKKMYNISHPLYLKAIDIAKKIQDAALLAKPQNNLALSYYLEGKLDSALYWHLQALQSRQKTGTKKDIAQSLNNIGLVYRIKKDYAHAIEYYRESLLLKKEVNDRKGILTTLLNISYAFKEDKKFDSSVYYAKACTKLAENNNNDLKEYYQSLTNTALSYNQQKKYSEALELLIQVENQKTAVSDAKNYPGCLSGIGEAYLGLKKYDKAIAYLNKALAMSVSSNILELTAELHNMLYEAYEAKGDYKTALQHFKEYKTYSDSLLNLSNIQNTNDLSARYETKQKEKEIALLNTENQVNILSIKNKQRTILLYTAGLLILLGIIIVTLYLYRNKQKTNTELEEKNKMISKALNEKEILLKEIHHRVKNNLQVISSLLNLQSKSIEDKKALEAIKEGRDRVKSMALIHQNLYQDDNLTGVDAKEYIDKLVHSLFVSYNIEPEKITLLTDIDPLQIDVDTIIPLGLILNELISNSLKYAFTERDTGKLEVKLKQLNENLLLEVNDDGKGLPEGWNKKTSSLGYQLIQSFVQKMKAELEVRNQNGTKVRMIITKFKLTT